MSILHVHSEYSLYDSGQTTDDICKRVKEIGAKSVTLTDHGTLLGIDDFMESGKKYDINTIPGVEAYTQNREHFILVAKNYKGFQAISYAMHDANMHIEKSKKLSFPIMGDDILIKYFKDNSDVIATTACVQGPAGAILLKNYRSVEKTNKERDKYSKACKDSESDYHKFVSIKDKINSLNINLKELKKEKKTVSKYLTPSYEGRIDNQKFKLDNTDINDKDYLKIKSKLNEMSELNSVSKSLANDYNKQIETLNKELTDLKKESKQYQSAFNKYNNANKKLAEIQEKFIPEEDLYQQAKGRINELTHIFPNFYIELQYHGLEIEQIVMPKLAQIAKELNIPVIAANDAHITDNSNDSIETRRIMRFNYFNKSEKTSNADKEMYIKTNDELKISLMQILPENIVNKAIENTNILDDCHVNFPKAKMGEHAPKTNDKDSLDDLINQRIEEEKEKGTWTNADQEEVDHELTIIKEMGYEDYHLVVRDFCNAARTLGVVPKDRRSDIPNNFDEAKRWIAEEGFCDGVGVGPGRGSAVGSKVCYLLGITDIDPMKYNLVFERYLNPERVSLPDIDSDIATSLRPYVIQYLKNKYGDDSVSSIATITRYGAKGAIQMAGRERASSLYGNNTEAIKNYLHAITYKLSDSVPEEPGIKISDCEKNLKAIIYSNTNSKAVLDVNKNSFSDEMNVVLNNARLIEGKVSGTGVHAGGVIISDNKKINDYVPLAWNSDNDVWVAQCDMIHAEEKGLLKMDLLGLKTLDVISDCLQLISQYDGEHIDISNLPFEDAVFQNIFATGNTNSVFQFESDGMKSLLKRFKPSCFEDLVLLVAAYRPGPMQYLDDIIEVKNGNKPIVYKHPLLKSILSETYGAVIYQEQVMQIFQKLAGYSLGGADLVRRAMGKKKMKVLKKERETFIHGDPDRNIIGCVENGVSEEIANELFDELIDFANYAFNKSHAVAYAMNAYQTAWLKYHFPAEFATAMFNNEDQDGFRPIIEDCHRNNIRLLPPSINDSDYLFSLEPSSSSQYYFSVRFGISGIKGIGKENEDLINSIIDNRVSNGPFLSIEDALIRSIRKKDNEFVTIPKKTIEIFINSGMFDFTGINRESLLKTFGRQFHSDSFENLVSLISNIQIDLLPSDSVLEKEKEIELLSTLVSVQPLALYKNPQQYGCYEFSQLNSVNYASVFGVLIDYAEGLTKNNNPMIRLTIEGTNDTIKTLGFGKFVTQYKDFIKNSLYTVVKISGKVDNGTIIMDNIYPMNTHSKIMVIPYISYDDQVFISEIDDKEIKDNNNPIKVVFINRETKNGNIYKVPTYYYFTLNAIQLCYKHGIHFEDPDRPEI